MRWREGGKRGKEEERERELFDVSWSSERRAQSVRLLVCDWIWA